MGRFCNIAISILFSLVLVGPALVYVCEKAHVALPSWATAEDAVWLAGGTGDSNVKANLGLVGFMSGEFQEAVDVVIGNHIPMKAQAMLENAAIQRWIIALSDIPFGWDCYSTYYGSERIYIPSVEAVSYIPRREPDGQLVALREFGSDAAKFAARNPNVDLVLFIVQGCYDPAVSPAYELVSDCMLPTDQVAAISEGAGDAANIHVVSVGYESLERYYADYFRTDHHWGYRGIGRAYNAIAAELGLVPFESPGEFEIEDYHFSGATARWGLDLIEEPASDTLYDFSPLTVVSPNGTSSPYNHDAFLGRSDPGKRYSFYDSYYGIESGSVVAGPGSGKSVLVSNSYGNGIMPYLAFNYATTFKYDVIHPEVRDASARLDSAVSAQNARTVFIVADPTTLAGFQEECPSFFDSAG